MQFKRYEKYKASGIDWLGEIPEGWEVKRVKDVISSNEKSLSNNEDPFLEIKYIDISNVGTDKLNNIPEVFYFQDAPSRARRIPRKNDVILSTVRTYLKAVYFFENIEENTICSTGFSVLTPKRILPVFLKYSVIGESFIDNVIKYSKGVSYPAINDSELTALPLFLPNKQTQTAIADYLDQHTALIDKKIELLKAKKQSYTELKQTIINEVVTKGLDKTAQMKESGIEWIGNIPKHWEVKRLKQIFDERVEKNSLPNGEAVTENILSVMKDVGVINHRDKGLVGNKMSEDITGYKLVHIYDIVVNKMNVMIGSVGISKEFGALSVIYIILKTKNNYSPNFYDYLFKIKRFQKHLRKISTGILEIREAVNMILFMGQEFPVPPKSEQISIANYLDEKTSKIDQIIKKIDDNILALQEFRKTLINDVVTGKVKVL